jgi:pimeloyl-ACP methyl ester carboxylesterase
MTVSRRLIAAIVLAAVAVALGLNTVMVDRQAAGGTINVTEDGPRGAPALVLIHGLGASTRWWDPIVGLLAGSCRVVRIDLLGHGRSAKPAGGGTRSPSRRAGSGRRWTGWASGMPSWSVIPPAGTSPRPSPNNEAIW